jgi:hypothetical protein
VITSNTRLPVLGRQKHCRYAIQLRVTAVFRLIANTFKNHPCVFNPENAAAALAALFISQQSDRKQP